MITVTNPITGQPLRELPAASAVDTDTVMSNAQAGAAHWRAVPPAVRAAQLRKVAQRLSDEADQFAALETENTGKPLSDTRREARRAADCFAYYSGLADTVVGETIQADPDMHTYTLREPHGVVLGIVPWNMPYAFAAKKIAAALAFGNASVLKPAPETPLTALRLRELMVDVGIPPEVNQVVVGDARVGASLVADPRVSLIVFTGSDAAGRAIARAAADNVTPTVLELGGKNPQIVFADADLSAALDAVMIGAYGSCGQMCIAGSRLLIQREIFNDFVSQLRDRVNSLTVGDPRIDGVDVGPQVTAPQRTKTMAMIDQATSDGATILAQAGLPTSPALKGGFFAPPTLFTDVTPEMAIMREEVFGPVLAAMPFSDEEHAVTLANDTRFGLAAGVWTNDLGRAHRVAAVLNAGTVWLNTYRVLNDRVPFGGFGASGYGRENGSEALRTYTRVKSVWTNTRPGLPTAYRNT